MITVSLKGDKELGARIEKAEQALSGQPLASALLYAGLVVAGQAQQNVTAGGTGLKVRTGRLRASINVRVKVRGSVSVGTNVKYAHIHEYGGTINHPGGTAYMLDDETGRAIWISNRRAGNNPWPRTKPHPITIPPRPFLRPALDTKRAEAMNIIRQVYAGPLNIEVR